MAAEAPFTELARVVDKVSKLHGQNVDKEDPDAETLSGATAVGSVYDKIDHDQGDLEAAPLRTGELPDGNEGWNAVKDNPGLVGKIRKGWRDYLVRTFRALAGELKEPRSAHAVLVLLVR